MNLIIFFIPRNVFYAAPGITHVGKDDALDFFSNGVTIFNGRFIHFVAAEFIVFIAAQRIGTAQGKEVVVGHVAGGNTAHETNGNDVSPADFIIEAVFCNELEVVEVTAHAVTGPNTGEGQAFPLRRIVDVIAVIENVRPGHAIGPAEVIL